VLAVDRRQGSLRICLVRVCETSRASLSQYNSALGTRLTICWARAARVATGGDARPKHFGDGAGHQLRARRPLGAILGG